MNPPRFSNFAVSANVTAYAYSLFGRGKALLVKRASRDTLSFYHCPFRRSASNKDERNGLLLI